MSIQLLLAVGGCVVCKSEVTSDLHTTQPPTQSDSCQLILSVVCCVSNLYDDSVLTEPMKSNFIFILLEEKQ